MQCAGVQRVSVEEDEVGAAREVRNPHRVERRLDPSPFCHRLGDPTRERRPVAEALERSRLGKRVDVERLANLADGLDPTATSDPVTDAQSTQTVRLAERPCDEQVVAATGERHDAAGVGRVDEVEVRLVDQDRQIVGKQPHEPLDRVGIAVDAGRVVGVAHDDQARALVHHRGHRVQVVPAVRGERDRDGLRACGGGQVRVDRKRRVGVNDRGPGIEHGLTREQDEFARAVAHDDLIHLDPMAVGQRRSQPPRVCIRIAVEACQALLHDRDNLGKRCKRALVGGQLDRRVQPVARQHLGRGEPGLIRGNRRQAR